MFGGDYPIEGWRLWLMITSLALITMFGMFLLFALQGSPYVAQ
jgi:hypothetical protein